MYDAQNGNDAYPASNFTTFNMGETVPEYLEMGTILADGGDTFGVSTVCFDTHEELLWMGNEGVSSEIVEFSVNSNSKGSYFNYLLLTFGVCE